MPKTSLRASFALVGLAALLSAGCASAPESETATTRIAASDGNGSGEAAADYDLQIICVRERVTGRLIPERVCMSRNAWRRVEESAREVGDALDQDGSMPGVDGFPGG